MSEEKLYGVKNDEGEYWDFFDTTFWLLATSDRPITRDKERAEQVADEHGGHVVTSIEEAEKVVLTKEQAKIVKGAHNGKFPASYISTKSDDEELLMKAYVNGYTVKKEKKYNVEVPKKWCGDDKYYWAKEQDGTLIWEWLINKEKKNTQFTMTEIEYYGLQDCEKVECDNDEQ